MSRKIILLGVFISISTAIIYAESNIIPEFSVKGMIDDNIYLDADDAVDSMVTVLEASVKTVGDNSQNNISFSGTGKYFFYSEAPEKNNNQQIIMNLSTRYDANGGISLSVSDAFKDTSDPASSELVERSKRMRNDAILKAVYKISQKTNLELSGSYIIHEYDRNSYSSYERNEFKGIFTGYYRFLPKTSLLLRACKGQTDYKADVNNSSDIVFELGIKGSLSTKVSALITTGYQIRQYEDETNDDVSVSVSKLDLMHEYSTKTTIKLATAYSIKESFATTSPHYNSLAVDIRLIKKPVRKLTMTLKADYILNNYPEESIIDNELKKIKDNIIAGSLNISYSLHKWWVSSLNYTYRNRDSVDDTRNYSNSKIGLQLATRFK